MTVQQISKMFFQTCKKNILIFFVMFSIVGCNNFLDVIPDNIADLDHAFATQKEAERFLATLYGHAPGVDLVSNPLFFGADDAWTWYDNHYSYNYAWQIARGEQNSNAPLVNAWDGCAHIPNMFKGIRKCNIFIEEVSKPEKLLDLDKYTRMRWLGEAKFLKAYYHFYLFRMYGPIPITDTNRGIDEDLSQVRVTRNTVDEVVDYLDKLLLESARDLPQFLNKELTESGRVTKGAALALRAKVLATAASPLFNGNPDYKGFKDNEGVELFPSEYSVEKWEKAAKACEQALDSLPEGMHLYRFTDPIPLSETTRTQLSFSGATTMRNNSEIIWGRYTSKGNSVYIQQGMLPPRLDPTIERAYNSSYLSITLGMVERYYTKNGVPINEDKEWPYAEKYKLKKTGGEQEFELQPNHLTAQLNIDREPRFYSSLAFDGSYVYLKSVPESSDKNAFEVHSLFGQANGVSGGREYTTVTGYFVKKLTQWELTITPQGVVGEFYPWPEIRLTDLYLLAAECYNEIGKNDLALYYIDMIRERSGLKTVQESWDKYSINPNKYKSVDGLREIIHQEREIELAFEGERLWDLKRWKKAADYLNNNVLGWNVRGKTPEDYYRPTLLFEQRFVTPRDYLWPLSIGELRRNPNLVQNPGW